MSNFQVQYYNKFTNNYSKLKELKYDIFKNNNNRSNIFNYYTNYLKHSQYYILVMILKH